MKSKLTIAFLILSLNCFSQTISFRECEKEMVFTLAEEMPVAIVGADSLKSFFQRSISTLGIEKTTVTVNFQLLIDNEGNACLSRLFDPPNTVPIANFKSIIKEMPKWKPAIQNTHKVNCWVRLSLSFRDGNVDEITCSTVTGKPLSF